MKHRNSLFITLAWLGVGCLSLLHGASPAAAKSSPNPEGLSGGELLNLDWQVYVAAKPIYCVLVEKDKQRLRLLRHDGRLRVVSEYTVATGEKPGPKEQEGDEKTPEGIYLITKGYLDRKVSIFGTRAYQLNYPNWFDLGAGRGGYGIYLHGTNKPLAPNSSNGCVTLQNSDMDKVADYLTVGTPVFIVPTLGRFPSEKSPSGYPDLTSHDFAGARELLLPAEGREAAFASLYLIRIHNQTLVAGEYWATPDSAAPRLAIAYLQHSPDNRWSVVDRGPLASDQQQEAVVTIATLPPELLAREGGTEEQGGEEVGPWLWEPAPEERLLSWLREAMLKPSAPVPVPALPVQAAVQSKTKAKEVSAGMVYLLFALTTALSVGSALVFIRRQGRRGGEGLLPLADGREASEGEALIEQVRAEVALAMDSLNTIRAKIDEEASQVASQEALQERMRGLETAFQEKESLLDRLTTEQEALKEQGEVERSGREEALGLLRGEMASLREQMEAARQEMAAAVAREERVNAELAEVKRLATTREEVVRADQDLQEVVTACDLLRGQVQALMGTIQQGPLAAEPRQEAPEVHHSDELFMALHNQAEQLKGLQSEVAAVRGAVDRSGVEAMLEQLRLELRESQSEKTELLARLTHLGELEGALAERERQIASLQSANEQAQARALTEKEGLDSSLRGLREELTQAQDKNRGLAQRLSRVEELERALAERQQEVEALRATDEALRSRALAEKEAQAAALAGVQEELRREQEARGDLAGRLTRISELEEVLSERDRQMEAVLMAGEEVRLRTEAEQRAQESALEALRRELGEEQEAKRALSDRLTRISELEEALSERDRQMEASLLAREEMRQQAAAAQQDHESALAALRAELEAERQAKGEAAASQSGRVTALETLLAEREQEIKGVLAAKEELSLQFTTEKGQLEATVAELVLARQVEVSSLSRALQEAREKVASGQESMALLRQEVEAMNEALRQRTEHEQEAAQRVLEQERVVAALQQELSSFKARVAELEKKSEMGDGVVLIKGSHYLPGDVLRKWIGKESSQ